MIEYNQFFLKFSAKKDTHVENPRIFRLKTFTLPKRACHHYIGYGDNDIGPVFNNPLYNEVKNLIPVYSYTELSTKAGNPILKSIPIVDKLKKHIRENNKKLRYVPSLKGVQPLPNVPLVMNYALCGARYKYQGEVQKIPYWESVNKANTLIDGIRKVNKDYNYYYQHFIFIDVPQLSQLMPISMMIRAVNQMNLNLYSKLGDFNQYIIYQLWLLLGRNKEKSIFNGFSPKDLDTVNFVFTVNNVFFTFNLGKLLNWRKSEENPSGTIEPKLLSKYFIVSLIRINKSIKETKLIELTEEELLERKSDVQDLQTDSEERDEKFEKKDKNRSRRQQDEDKDFDEVDVVETQEVEESDSPIEIPLEIADKVDDDVELVSSILDADEDELDLPSEKLSSLPVSLKEGSSIKYFSEDNVESKSEFTETIEKISPHDALSLANYPVEDKVNLVTIRDNVVSPEEKARRILDEVATSTSMTVSKFDNLRKSASKYKQITLDKNGKTLAEMADIKPEETVISEEDLKNDSSIEVMDTKYINEFMERDVVSMVVGLQAGGALVQDMSKQVLNNASGESVMYSVKIKPIEGEPSTIRFRIPKLDDEGAFKVAGKTYRFLKQRFALPIVKVDDSTVSLSSYFGKTFVKRDPTRKYNYEKWLISEIRLAALDKDNKKVLETRSANVFDNNLKIANIISLLSMHFRAITLDDAYVYLDYHKAKERFSPSLVEQCEKLGYTFAGIYKKQYALAVDKDDNWLAIINGDVKLLGDTEDLFGFNRYKRPIEAINIELMGKRLPVGIVLGYKLGLTKLLASLNPKYYRTAPARTRTALEPHEYSIDFEDYKLILSTRDRLASLIMSGWRRVEDEIKNHSIYLMDKPDVYFSLLEEMKIPGRILKEVDLYYNLFVDPITERILLEMGEPTDFGGLLVRATEMLLTRDHKDETDTSQQRIRGYERMAGEVYTQMVRAFRIHNRHGIKSYYPIELNPEAVWMGIMTDTTKMLEEKLNPLQDLKQSQALTYSGNGGRSRVSLVKSVRSYHTNSIGLISEASVDSHDSGNRVFLSSKPRIKNIYGVPTVKDGQVELDKLKPEEVMSTVALMNPAIDTDDFFGCQ